MTQPLSLSSSDKKVLALLQEDSSRSKQELAEAAGMSASTLWRKLGELEASGAISKRVSLLDPIKVGFPVCAILSINLISHEKALREEFESFVADHPEIMECYLVTGEFDYMLIARTRSVQDFELLLMNDILSHKAVASTSSQIALSRKKYTTALPL